MPGFNSKVDDYIAKSEDFAKPILEHLRQIIHDTCTDVEETVKWSYPHFEYKGDFLCILGAFKKHCSFSLYKAELMKDPKIAESVKAGKKMGYMDKITSISDLPSVDVLTSYIKEAMYLNETGVKKARVTPSTAKEINIPNYFIKLLSENQRAKEIFESKSPSFRKEYVAWIIDAKTDATRQKRMDQALEWISEGKGRFWQYQKK